MALTPLARRKVETNSDLFKDLTVSPINFDLARKVDEESVKEAIKNLVLTDRGERLFQPELGCDVRKLLFENVTPDMILIAKDMIRNTIEAYEPRANLIDVDVLGDLDRNSVAIIIIFSVINRDEPITLSLTLDRVR